MRARLISRVVGLGLLLPLSCSVAEVSAVDSAAYRAKLSRDGCITKVPGVPFYSKTAQCNQETAYLVNVVTVTFVPGKAGTIPETRTFVGPAPGTVRDIEAFLKATSTADAAALDEQWSRLVPGQPEGALVSNRIVQGLKVDDGITYFINGNHPWAGTGSIQFDLAPDQTLTKVGASVSEQTLETTLGGLPGLLSSLGVGRKSETDQKPVADAQIDRRLLVLRRRNIGCDATPTAIPLSDLTNVESEIVDPNKPPPARAPEKSTKITFKGELEKTGQ